MASGRIRKKPRGKPRPRKGKPGAAVIGLELMLTRAEIARLEDLAASDLRSVNRYAGWLVALDPSRPAPKRTASSVRGARAGDRRVPLKVNLSLPRDVRDELLARSEAEMRSLSGYAGWGVAESLAGE